MVKAIVSHPAKDRRSAGKLGTGFSHKLNPAVPLDLSKVKTIDDLVRGMGDTSFSARAVGQAADVLEAMAKDRDCYKVLTLSGAMTIAKMGLVICDMIDGGMVDAVVSTGALVAHGFVESAGMKHFKHEWHMDDTQLYYAGYNRVYDTIELETNLDEAEDIMKKVLEKFDPEVPIGSHDLNKELGKYLHENEEGRGILKSAYEKNVPFYIPAFTDSELGLDFALYNRARNSRGEKPLRYDAFADLEDFAERVLKQKKLGIFTIGGGVPRNWAQQVGPYLDLVYYRLKAAGVPEEKIGKKEDYFKRFHYAVRICPEPVHWGGLSGATYSEGVSWGKFVPREEGGMWVEVLEDATVAWPLVVKAVMERMKKIK